MYNQSTIYYGTNNHKNRIKIAFKAQNFWKRKPTSRSFNFKLQTNCQSKFEIGDLPQSYFLKQDQALAAHQPDLVWLELGANDGLQGFSITVPKGNLAKMIQLCQAHGGTVLLAEMYIPPNYGPRYSQAFVSMYGDLAKEFNLTLVPFFMARVATQPDYMFADGIHPNTKAQPLIAEDVANSLLDALKNHAKPNN